MKADLLPSVDLPTPVPSDPPSHFRVDEQLGIPLARSLLALCVKPGSADRRAGTDLVRGGEIRRALPSFCSLLPQRWGRRGDRGSGSGCAISRASHLEILLERARTSWDMLTSRSNTFGYMSTSELEDDLDELAFPVLFAAGRKIRR